MRALSGSAASAGLLQLVDQLFERPHTATRIAQLASILADAEDDTRSWILQRAFHAGVGLSDLLAIAARVSESWYLGTSQAPARSCSTMLAELSRPPVLSEGVWAEAIAEHTAATPHLAAPFLALCPDSLLAELVGAWDRLGFAPERLVDAGADAARAFETRLAQVLPQAAYLTWCTRVLLCTQDPETFAATLERSITNGRSLWDVWPRMRQGGLEASEILGRLPPERWPWLLDTLWEGSGPDLPRLLAILREVSGTAAGKRLGARWVAERRDLAPLLQELPAGAPLAHAFTLLSHDQRQEFVRQAREDQLACLCDAGHASRIRKLLLDDDSSGGRLFSLSSLSVRLASAGSMSPALERTVHGLTRPRKVELLTALWCGDAQSPPDAGVLTVALLREDAQGLVWELARVHPQGYSALHAQLAAAIEAEIWHSLEIWDANELTLCEMHGLPGPHEPLPEAVAEAVDPRDLALVERLEKIVLDARAAVMALAVACDEQSLEVYLRSSALHTRDLWTQETTYKLALSRYTHVETLSDLAARAESLLCDASTGRAAARARRILEGSRAHLTIAARLRVLGGELSFLQSDPVVEVDTLRACLVLQRDVERACAEGQEPNSDEPEVDSLSESKLAEEMAQLQRIELEAEDSIEGLGSLLARCHEQLAQRPLVLLAPVWESQRALLHQASRKVQTAQRRLRDRQHQARHKFEELQQRFELIENDRLHCEDLRESILAQAPGPGPEIDGRTAVEVVDSMSAGLGLEPTRPGGYTQRTLYLWTLAQRRALLDAYAVLPLPEVGSDAVLVVLSELEKRDLQGFAELVGLPKDASEPALEQAIAVWLADGGVADSRHPFVTMGSLWARADAALRGLKGRLVPGAAPPPREPEALWAMTSELLTQLGTADTEPPGQLSAQEFCALAELGAGRVPKEAEGFLTALNGEILKDVAQELDLAKVTSAWDITWSARACPPGAMCAAARPSELARFVDCAGFVRYLTSALASGSWEPQKDYSLARSQSTASKPTPKVVVPADPLQNAIAHLDALLASARITARLCAEGEDANQDLGQLLLSIDAALASERSARAATDDNTRSTPLHSSVRHLWYHFVGSTGHDGVRRPAFILAELAAPSVVSLSPRPTLALLWTLLEPYASNDTYGGANVDHLASVSLGVLQSAVQAKGDALLTQADIDLLIVETFLTDATAKGRTPTELADMPTAPIRAGSTVITTGKEFWSRAVSHQLAKLYATPQIWDHGETPLDASQQEHVRQAIAELVAEYTALKAADLEAALAGDETLSEPEASVLRRIWGRTVLAQPFVAGTLLHGLVAFSLVRRFAHAAGYDDAQARLFYLSVLGHHMSGFIAHGLAQVDLTVDFAILVDTDVLTSAQASVLQELYDSAISLARVWRPRIDSSYPTLRRAERRAYQEAAARLRAAIAALPSAVQSQLFNDDWQQYTEVGIAKWLHMMNEIFRPRTNRDLVVATFRPAQAYLEEAWARGDAAGTRFEEVAQVALMRLGVALDASDAEFGSYFRLAHDEEPAQWELAQRVLRDTTLRAAFPDSVPEPLTSATVASVVRWFYRRSPPDLDALIRIASYPRP